MLTKLCAFRVFIFSVPCFLFLSFPSDRDSSTKSSVNKIGKTASRSGSPALNDPTLTNLVRNERIFLFGTRVVHFTPLP